MQRWLRLLGATVMAVVVLVGATVLVGTPAGATTYVDSTGSSPGTSTTAATSTQCDSHRKAQLMLDVTYLDAVVFPDTKLVDLWINGTDAGGGTFSSTPPVSLSQGQTRRFWIDLGVASTAGGTVHVEWGDSAAVGSYPIDLTYGPRDCSHFSYFTATSTCDPAYGVDLHFNLGPTDVNGDPQIARFTVTTTTGVTKTVDVQGGNTGSVDLGSAAALEGTTATISAVSTIYGDIWSEAGTGSVVLACSGESDSEALVRALYQAVLERQPDSGGLAYWAAKFDAGTAPSKLAETLARSREGYSQVVKRHFQLALNRGTDPSGLTYWTNKLQATNAPDTLLTNLFGSSEAYRKGGSTNTGYVTYVYNRVLGRSPDSGGLAYWAGKIDKAKDPAAVRRTVARTILFSSEGLRRQVQANHNAVCGVDAPAASLPTYTAKYQASNLNPSTLRAAIVIAGCPA